MGLKLYPPQIEGTLPAFWLTYDGSNTSIIGASITIPYMDSATVSSDTVSGFCLRLRTASTGSYLFEPIFSSAINFVNGTVTFELSASQARKLNEGQYYKVQIAYCNAGPSDTGYFSTVGIIKCTSKPTVYMNNLNPNNINFFTNEFVGIYDQSTCKDQSEKVYSYEFIIYNEDGEIFYTTGEKLHQSAYDTEYSFSVDKVLINDYVSSGKTYSIQYKVTTLNGLELYSPIYKLTNENLVSPNKNIIIKPKNNPDNGYITINFEGDLDLSKSWYYILDENNTAIIAEQQSNYSFEHNQKKYKLDFYGHSIYNIIKLGLESTTEKITFLTKYSLYKYTSSPNEFIYLQYNYPTGDNIEWATRKWEIDRLNLYYKIKQYLNSDSEYDPNNEYYDIFENKKYTYNSGWKYDRQYLYTFIYQPIEDNAIYDSEKIYYEKQFKYFSYKWDFNNKENDNYILINKGNEIIKSLSYQYVLDNNIDLNNYLVLASAPYEAFYYGAYILSRASDEDNYTTWYNIARFRLDEQPPSSYSVQDITIEHGRKYKYGLQQYNVWGLVSSRITSDLIEASFEDMFLYDGERLLKVRFNPEVSSFKTTILEQKTDTLGGRFPFITRNGDTYYKEFPIGGLIAQEMDEDELFINRGFVTTGRKSTKAVEQQEHHNAIRDYHMFSDENIFLERQFKLEVLKWLNDGKPKLFKSPYEGNYIIRLMNNTLTPVKELGRMLHSFSSQAYEIAECDYENLVAYGFIDVKLPSSYVGLWRTYYLQDKTLKQSNGDILIQCDGGLDSFVIQDMMPGDKVYIYFQDSMEPEEIMIGITGSYSYTADKPVTQIRVRVMSPIEQTDYRNETGVIHCYYHGLRITAFDAIINQQLSTIVGQQYIGVDPALLTPGKPEYSWTDSDHNLYNISKALYKGLQNYNFRDYLSLTVQPKTNNEDSYFKYEINSNFVKYYRSFEPHEILDRINLTIGDGQAYKIQLLNIEQLKFRLRELIPVFCIDITDNSNTVLDSPIIGVPYKAGSKVIGQINSSSQNIQYVATSPYGYPHRIEELVEVELLDPFCIFEVFELYDGKWQPNYNYHYYDPYYKQWIPEYEPYVKLNYVWDKVMFNPTSEEYNGAFPVRTAYTKNHYNFSHDLTDSYVYVFKKGTQKSVNQNETYNDNIIYLHKDSNNNIRRYIYTTLENWENEKTSCYYYTIPSFPYVEADNKNYYIYINFKNLYDSNIDPNIRDKYGIKDQHQLYISRHSYYYKIGENTSPIFLDEFEHFCFFEKQNNSDNYFIERANTKDAYLDQNNENNKNKIFYVKRYETELNLLNEKEKEFTNFKDINSIWLGSGAIAELVFQIKIIDYYTEINNSQVAAAKQAYLDSKQFLVDLSNSYGIISESDYYWKKYLALKQAYQLFLKGTDKNPLSTREQETLSTLLNNLHEVEEMKFLKLYKIEKINSEEINLNSLQAIIDLKQNNELFISQSTTDIYDSHQKYYYKDDNNFYYLYTDIDISEPEIWQLKKNDLYILEDIILLSSNVEEDIQYYVVKKKDIKVPEIYATKTVLRENFIKNKYYTYVSTRQPCFQLAASFYNNTQYYEKIDSSFNNKDCILYRQYDNETQETIYYLVNQKALYQIYKDKNTGPFFSNQYTIKYCIGEDIPYSINNINDIVITNENKIDQNLEIVETIILDTKLIISSRELLSQEEVENIKNNELTISLEEIIYQENEENTFYEKESLEALTHSDTTNDKLHIEGVEGKLQSLNEQIDSTGGFNDQINQKNEEINKYINDYIKLLDDINNEVSKYNEQVYQSWSYRELARILENITYIPYNYMDTYLNENIKIEPNYLITYTNITNNLENHKNNIFKKINNNYYKINDSDSSFDYNNNIEQYYTINVTDETNYTQSTNGTTINIDPLEYYNTNKANRRFFLLQYSEEYQMFNDTTHWNENKTNLYILQSNDCYKYSHTSGKLDSQITYYYGDALNTESASIYLRAEDINNQIIEYKGNEHKRVLWNFYNNKQQIYIQGYKQVTSQPTYNQNNNLKYYYKNFKLLSNDRDINASNIQQLIQNGLYFYQNNIHVKITDENTEYNNQLAYYVIDIKQPQVYTEIDFTSITDPQNALNNYFNDNNLFIIEYQHPGQNYDSSIIYYYKDNNSTTFELFSESLVRSKLYIRTLVPASYYIPVSEQDTFKEGVTYFTKQINYFIPFIKNDQTWDNDKEKLYVADEENLTSIENFFSGITEYVDAALLESIKNITKYSTVIDNLYKRYDTLLPEITRFEQIQKDNNNDQELDEYLEQVICSYRGQAILYLLIMHKALIEFWEKINPNSTNNNGSTEYYTKYKNLLINGIEKYNDIYQKVIGINSNYQIPEVYWNNLSSININDNSVQGYIPLLKNEFKKVYLKHREAFYKAQSEGDILHEMQDLSTVMNLYDDISFITNLQNWKIQTIENEQNRKIVTNYIIPIDDDIYYIYNILPQNYNPNDKNFEVNTLMFNKSINVNVENENIDTNNYFNGINNNNRPRQEFEQEWRNFSQKNLQDFKGHGYRELDVFYYREPISVTVIRNSDIFKPNEIKYNTFIFNPLSDKVCDNNMPYHTEIINNKETIVLDYSVNKEYYESLNASSQSDVLSLNQIVSNNILNIIKDLSSSQKANIGTNFGKIDALKSIKQNYEIVQSNSSENPSLSTPILNQKRKDIQNSEIFNNLKNMLYNLPNNTAPAILRFLSTSRSFLLMDTSSYNNEDPTDFKIPNSLIVDRTSLVGTSDGTPGIGEILDPTGANGIDSIGDGVVKEYLQETLLKEIEKLQILLEQAVELQQLYQKQYENYQTKLTEYNELFDNYIAIYNSYVGTEMLEFYENSTIDAMDEYRNKVREAWWYFLNILDEEYTKELERGMYV